MPGIRVAEQDRMGTHMELHGIRATHSAIHSTVRHTQNDAPSSPTQDTGKKRHVLANSRHRPPCPATRLASNPRPPAPAPAPPPLLSY